MSGLHEFGTIVNIIGGILLAYGYLPQLYSLIKTKDPGNNSVQYWVIMTFGIFCIGVNQFIYKLPKVQLVTQSFICTVVLIYYVAKKKKKVNA